MNKYSDRYPSAFGLDGDEDTGEGMPNFDEYNASKPQREAADAKRQAAEQAKRDAGLVPHTEVVGLDEGNPDVWVPKPGTEITKEAENIVRKEKLERKIDDAKRDIERQEKHIESAQKMTRAYWEEKARKAKQIAERRAYEGHAHHADEERAQLIREHEALLAQAKSRLAEAQLELEALNAPAPEPPAKPNPFVNPAQNALPDAERISENVRRDALYDRRPELATLRDLGTIIAHAITDAGEDTETPRGIYRTLNPESGEDIKFDASQGQIAASAALIGQYMARLDALHKRGIDKLKDIMNLMSVEVDPERMWVQREGWAWAKDLICFRIFEVLTDSVELPASEVGARYGLAEATVRQAINRGALPARKVGRDWVVRLADAEARWRK